MWSLGISPTRQVHSALCQLMSFLIVPRTLCNRFLRGEAASGVGHAGSSGEPTCERWTTSWRMGKLLGRSASLGRVYLPGFDSFEVAQHFCVVAGSIVAWGGRAWCGGCASSCNAGVDSSERTWRRRVSPGFVGDGRWFPWRVWEWRGRRLGTPGAGFAGKSWMVEEGPAHEAAAEGRSLSARWVPLHG